MILGKSFRTGQIEFTDLLGVVCSVADPRSFLEEPGPDGHTYATSSTVAIRTCSATVSRTLAGTSYAVAGRRYRLLLGSHVPRDLRLPLTSRRNVVLDGYVRAVRINFNVNFDDEPARKPLLAHVQ